MAYVDKNGYIKTKDANGDIITIYPITQMKNVDGLDVFGASGNNHSTGLVPDPGSTTGASKYLREDGVWAEPSGGSGSGTVTGVKVGTSTYSPGSNGIVSIPAYPTSLPANGGTASNVSGTVAIANGGTGSTSASGARTNLGLGSAATKSSTSSVTSGSSSLVTSGAVYTELSNLPLQKVSDNNSSSSKSYSYTMKESDFVANKGAGTYLIFIISWSTTPTFSLYAASFGGGNTNHDVVTKIAGSDATVSASGGVISVTASGRMLIYALK